MKLENIILQQIILLIFYKSNSLYTPDKLLHEDEIEGICVPTVEESC